MNKKPEDIELMKCNISALSEYSDLSPGAQEFYAFDNNDFRYLEESNVLENVNMDEGRFLIEEFCRQADFTEFHLSFH